MKALVSDPFVTTVILGTLWPLVQAALDQPWWTKRRRVGGVNVLGWAGIVTPGGETRDHYQPRHEAA